MEYVRKVDEAAVAAAAPNERFQQWLLDHTSGGKHCSINWIRTPAGGGSPAGMHTHVVDQIFYILERHDEPGDRGQGVPGRPGHAGGLPGGRAAPQLERRQRADRPPGVQYADA